MAIIFAIILLGATYIYPIFRVFLGTVGMFAVQGLLYMPAILIAYIMRRPGAALIAQTVISLVSAPFHPWGWMELSGILFIGLPIELAFWAIRYRNYRLPVLAVACSLVGFVRIIVLWVPFGINVMGREAQMVIVAITIVGALVTALAAKLLADSIAKTGVLSSYAVGQEQREEI